MKEKSLKTKKMKIELTEIEIEQVREALYEYFCFDCDVEPTFCPIQGLIEKFGGRCQWETKN